MPLIPIPHHENLPFILLFWGICLICLGFSAAFSQTPSFLILVFLNSAQYKKVSTQKTQSINLAIHGDMEYYSWACLLSISQCFYLSCECESEISVPECEMTDTLSQATLFLHTSLFFSGKQENGNAGLGDNSERSLCSFYNNITHKRSWRISERNLLLEIKNQSGPPRPISTLSK